LISYWLNYPQSFLVFAMNRRRWAQIQADYLLQKPTLPCPYFWRDTALCLCICRLMCVYVSVCSSGCRTRKKPFSCATCDDVWRIRMIGNWRNSHFDTFRHSSPDFMCSCELTVSWSTVPSSSLDFLTVMANFPLHFDTIISVERLLILADFAALW